jgi:hypothetical protein
MAFNARRRRMWYRILREMGATFEVALQYRDKGLEDISEMLETLTALKRKKSHVAQDRVSAVKART